MFPLTDMISWNSESFLLDGHHFQIFSGEMHYQRIPREYWRVRLQMVRAMGLNTVAIYMFWNQHEPHPDEFDFSGQNDVATFVRLAQEEGLYVLLRPGPYCCAEWDFGGFPPYLLKSGTIRVRCMDTEYITAIERYIRRWSQELVPLQSTRGGPILMVQVENEYGSYGRDKEYLRLVHSLLSEVGFEIPHYTCDGYSKEALLGGTLPELLCTVNFGFNPQRAFTELNNFRPNIPHMCSEYYPGWFNHWGDLMMVRTPTVRIKMVAKDIEWMIRNGKSFNLYMVHGGTSFGFSPGANHHHGYMPDITSYDYSAPIDESGRPTSAYFTYREILLKNQSHDNKIPEVPKIEPLISIPPIELLEFTPFMMNLGSSIQSPQIHSMEYYNQNNGFILYRTSLYHNYGGKSLVLNELHDYGYLFLNGQHFATLDRRGRKNGYFKVKIPKFEGDIAQLDILVESHGRINFGAYIIDRKGITEYVAINETPVLMNWEIFLLPLDENYLQQLQYSSVSSQKTNEPTFYRGKFAINMPGDTFLDLRGWKKGMVWVNGHNLGRYWHIGPQYSLYLPGAWLKSGSNEIILLAMEGPQNPIFLRRILCSVRKQKKIPISISNLNCPPIWGLPYPIR